MIDAASDVQEAEKLISAAVESCDILRDRLDGSEKAAVTRLRTGLRLALDRLGGAIDALQVKTRPER